jgi:hypothetical protein
LTQKTFGKPFLLADEVWCTLNIEFVHQHTACPNYGSFLIQPKQFFR